MSSDGLKFFDWLIEQVDNIPPVVLGLLGFIIIACILILIISSGIIALDKQRWIVDIDTKLLREPFLLYSDLGEQLVAELTFLTFSEALEITDIKSKIVKDGIDAFGDAANLEIIRIEKQNQNLRTEKVEKFEYFTAIDILPALSTSRQKIFFSIKNGENKVRSLLEIFKLQAYDFIKQAEEYKTENGSINKEYVRTSLIDLKKQFLNQIVDAVKIVDGDYKLRLEIEYRMLNKEGKKSKDQFSSIQHVDFRVKKVKELLRMELDDILAKIIVNLMNSPASGPELKPIMIATTKLNEIISN